MYQYSNNNDNFLYKGIYGVTHHDQLFSTEAQNSQSSEYQEAIDKQVSLSPCWELFECIQLVAINIAENPKCSLAVLRFSMRLKQCY